MKTVHLVLFAMLSLLAACGGGSDDTGSGAPVTAVQQEYRMWKCTIYRRTEGLTGLQYWSSCPNENWRLKADQPVFTSLSACEDEIRVLKASDSVIYNNSDEDRARGWAVKLLCFEPDITPPAVLSVTPADGSSGFPIDGSRLRVDFSDNMDSATITTSSFTLEDSSGTQIAGTVIYGYEQRAAVFDSNDPLEYLATYTARLTTDITDKVGNPLAGEYTWSFTTEDVPQPAANTPSPQLTFNLPQPEGTWVPIATPATFGPRTGHRAVWTGSDMIIWGGINWQDPTFPWLLYPNDGARYDPALDQWNSISTLNAPRGRTQHTATWTGSEMIVWGGSFGSGATDTGARYDPATDSWTAMTTLDAPSARARHTAIWTGSELIIWGGTGENDGARYDPVTDTWSPLSLINAPIVRDGHEAVFDGQRMIIWGGKTPTLSVNTDGAQYDPVADVWTPLPSQNAPGGNGPYEPASVVSTGTDMLVCLPKEEWSYDPDADDWFSVWVSETRRFNYQDQQWLNVVDGCNPQATPHAVWVDNRILSWNSNYALGQIHNVQFDTWAPLPPYPDMFGGGATALVAGDEVIVWGGRNMVDAGSRDVATNLGYRLVF